MDTDTPLGTASPHRPHALGRTLGWTLTMTGKIAHIIGRILCAVLWALGFLAFLSIVGYALELGGNQQRHH